MSEESDSNQEELIQEQLRADSIAIPPISEIVDSTIRKTNLQIGGRDMLMLSISSFFAFLLMIFGPIAATLAKNKKPE